MSQIRRQSIISSFIILTGFAIGLVNNMIFGQEKWFSLDEYGLTRNLSDFGQVIFAGSFWGMNAVLYKFFPYYESHTTKKENDLLGWALIIPLIGFLLFAIGGFVFEDFFMRKFGKSQLLVHYYHLIYPFGLGILIFAILEAYCWCLRKSVLTSFLKELLLRVLTSILIALYLSGILNYDLFIKLFSLLYIILVIALLLLLRRSGQLHLTLKPSRLTRRLKKKMAVFGLFIFAGTLMSVVASVIDGLIITSVLGPISNGIFAFNNYVSNIIQVPQRSIIAATIPTLAGYWKDKKLDKINVIYKRSSINLLLASTFLFGLIWLNYHDGITVFHLNKEIEEGKWLAFFMGLKFIVDMGTGVNGQIIGTSNYWRFEFITGIILLVLMCFLNYVLINKIGIVGAGVSNLIAYSIYNAIRIWFLWKKYRMQPFSINSFYTILLAVTAYFAAYFCGYSLSGWAALFVRSAVFVVVFVTGTYKFNLTPDLLPVVATIKKRLGFKPH
jgi:O-antigen/teichoic acid export membrane protein